jgi:hypothetical protein
MKRWPGIPSLTWIHKQIFIFPRTDGRLIIAAINLAYGKMCIDEQENGRKNESNHWKFRFHPFLLGSSIQGHISEIHAINASLLKEYSAY